MKHAMHNEPADWEEVKARIMQRHVAEGDCWEWKSFTIRGSVPVLHHKTVDGKNVASPVRKLVAFLWGRNVPTGYKCVTTCGNHMCVNPDHVLILRQRDHLRRAAKMATKAANNKVRVAKIAETRRSRHAKLDWGKVKAIRSSDGTYAELSAAYGVSKTVIGKIKRYEVWVDHTAQSNPFAALFR